MKLDTFLQSRFVAPVIKFFRTNLLLKIFALALTALIFELAPRDKMEFKEFQDVPVRVLVSGKNMIVEDKDTFVRVTLKGQKIDPHLTGSDLKVELDTKEGQYSRDGKFISWTLTPSDITVPWGLSCESIRPGTLTLPVDTLGKRQVKIKPVFTDELPPNLTLGKVMVTPAFVMVEGPSSLLRSIESVSVVPIRLKGISRTFDCDQELDRGKYPGFHFSQSKVLVQVEVLPALVDRKFTDVPVRILTSPGNAKKKFLCKILSSPAVDVTLTAGKNISESLRKEDFFPFVDVSAFTRPGRYEMDVRCAFELSHVRVKKVSPRRISILLTEIRE